MAAARVAALSALLEQQGVKMRDVQKMCFDGIPDSHGLRARAWKVLLRYAPVEPGSQAAALASGRALYYTFVDETVVGPPDDGDDHPLNTSGASKWQVYFKDNDVLKQIDRDVRRTLPDMGLLQTPLGKVNSHMAARAPLAFRLLQRIYTPETKPPPTFAITGRPEDELHWQVLQRILFVYAKLNPGIGYIQGMNDIVSHIYYVFATDPDAAAREYAEADTFHCFLSLMSDVREYYVTSLDNTSEGIRAAMALLMQRLNETDYELWCHLEDKQVHPQFYSFRWLTLLLSQEFALPDVLRLWDTLFSVDDRLEFMMNVCCAMLTCVRDELLDSDLSEILEKLQRYPISDVTVVLREAQRLINMR